MRGRYPSIVFLIQPGGGLVARSQEALVFGVFGLHVVVIIPGFLHKFRVHRMSSIVIACTFGPATAPLCAIGVAIETPLAQLCPGPPGMLECWKDTCAFRRVTD